MYRKSLLPIFVIVLFSQVLRNSPVLAISTRFEINTLLLDQMTATQKPAAKAKKAAKQTRPQNNLTAKSATRKLSRAADGSRLSASSRLSLIKSNENSRATGISSARQAWDLILPSARLSHSGIALNGENFTLSIDPERYPVLPAADGGKILIDAGGSLPQLVRNLIQYQDDQIRIVSEDPQYRKQFFASLLEAGAFHSVDENFTVQFGADPQLNITSDFKIEKSPDSLKENDLLLLNVTDARTGVPPNLASFLKRHGFTVVEPYPPSLHHSGVERSHILHQVSSSTPFGIADRLLDSLEIRYNSNAMVELFGPGDAGLRLDIRADRYFEVGSDRYLVSRFNGDPVSYTLMRIMETRGYKVIILEEQDDFRRVVEKLLSRLRISGSFGRHTLWPEHEQPYSIRLTGYMLHSEPEGRKILLTDRKLDPMTAELATMNGYRITRE